MAGAFGGVTWVAKQRLAVYIFGQVPSRPRCVRADMSMDRFLLSTRLGTMVIEFMLNGKKVSSQAAEDTPLLWVIRNEFALKGTKFGCGIAQCGV